MRHAFAPRRRIPHLLRADEAAGGARRGVGRRRVERSRRRRPARATERDRRGEPKEASRQAQAAHSLLSRRRHRDAGTRLSAEQCLQPGVSLAADRDAGSVGEDRDVAALRVGLQPRDRIDADEVRPVHADEPARIECRRQARERLGLQKGLPLARELYVVVLSARGERACRPG